MKLEVKVWELMARAGIRRQKELAVKANLSEALVSKLVAGNMKGIKFSTLASLCEALDCEPGDLIKIDSKAS
ncbi:MAG TPA: transcriptional regulator [Candidatus Latescibacteria bacterium]|nr:transcriptional regulator [Gemmatimonadota bacterium]HCR16415.1 transcriptional regulator [Candidatus Latescibacterota bacterium]|tara:strand:+ start:4110 stop:4325 length:216 start_codon:yes stop_codon:yes gene_type:complete